MSCKAGIGLQHFADGRTGKRAAPIMVPNHGANLRGEIRSKPAWIFSRPALFASEHEFARDPAHIHLVVEIFHRRAAELPRQTATCRAAADDLIAEEGIEIINRVDMRRRGIRTGMTESTHKTLHTPQTNQNSTAPNRESGWCTVGNKEGPV